MIRKYTDSKRTHWQSLDRLSSGIVEPLSDADRAAILPEDPPHPEPPAPVDPRDAKIAALEERISLLEKKVNKS